MTTQTSHIEQQLCRYLVDTRFEDLPHEVVQYCKQMIIDSLGVSIPGSRAPGCREVAALADQWGGDSGATVMVHGYKTTPPMAALANSAMMHALDFDDTLDASALHTFVSILPAVLAASETRAKVTGPELITSIVLGVDIINRLSLAISRPLSWIRTATCGSFGAAAAVGKLLNLDADQMANALGIVYSQTSGNAQGLIEGRLVKRLQPGFAAQAGVTSAFLAQQGITGSQAFLTGEYGFYSLYEHGEYNLEPVTRDLGVHYTITDLSIKPYPSCRMTHSSVDAALELRPGIFDRLGDIKEIQVTGSSMVRQMVGQPFNPGNTPQVDAQFSVPYTVATALVKGEVFLDHFEDKAISDPKVRTLADKVRVIASDDLPAKDIFHSKIKIIMKDGQIQETEVDIPLGNPGKPMDMARCREKFRRCIVFSKLEFDEDRQNRLLNRVEHLETMDNVQEIVELMTL